MPDTELTPWQRLVLAFWALFAVLFRLDVAQAVARVREERRASLPPANPGARPEPTRAEPVFAPPAPPAAPAKPAAAPPPKEAALPKAGEKSAPAPTAAKAVPAAATAPVPAPAAAKPAAEPVKPAAQPAKPAPEPVKPSPEPAAAKPAPATAAVPDTRAALQVLSILQREGRLVDFIEEDLAGFPDSAIGAAARTVHAGCKRAIEELFRLEPVYREAEGAQVTVAAGFDPAAIRLTGNVVGKPPFKGSLKHHGWRAREVKLPAADGKDPNILAPAEVEL
jgi:hypothetical protein